MKLFNSISSLSDNNIQLKTFFKRKSGNINSLSHELQVKNKKEEKEKNEVIIEDKKKPKIARTNIIIKTKNHDKKVHINKMKK